MNKPIWVCLLFIALFTGCGALSSLAEFNPVYSGVHVNASVAPADGKTAIQVSVQLQYAANLAARNIPVVLVATGTGATLGATSGVTDANGLFRTTLTSSVPGVVRLAANIQGQSATSALQASVQFVSVATGASLSYSAIATVGEPQTATVTILDDAGQRVLYYDGTISFSSSDPLAVLPSIYQFTSADQGQHSFDGVTLLTAGTQNLAVRDAGNANIVARVDGIKVYLKTAPMLEISGIDDALAGTVNHVKIRAIDISQETQTGYTGTVQFSSTDPQASLPPNTTFTATDAGVKVLPLTLKTAGAQSVSAVDANNLSINGTQSGIDVLVQADRFAVVAHAPTTAGVPVAVQTTAIDAYGNKDPNYAGPAIFSSSDVRALLPSAYAFTPADQGVHDVNITFYTSGGQTVEVQGASAGFSGQASLAVAGAPVRRLALLAPGQAVAGTSTTLVATAYDLYGNVSSGYAGVLQVTSSDANASLPLSVQSQVQPLAQQLLPPSSSRMQVYRPSP